MAILEDEEVVAGPAVGNLVKSGDDGRPCLTPLLDDEAAKHQQRLSCEDIWPLMRMTSLSGESAFSLRFEMLWSNSLFFPICLG